MVLLFCIFVVAILIFLCTFGCYRIAFYAKRNAVDPYEIQVPEGAEYEPFHEQMIEWTKGIRSMPHHDFWIQSFDGLTLHGKFYEYAPGAPMELMFHGYRGTAERDLSGGVHRCFQLGRSALIVDQRCSGFSDGKTITFGILEHRDCLSWVDFAVKEFGSDVRIILTGISMGAATVLMAAGKELPSNVIGVLADCGYTSPKEIIFDVIHKMRLPPAICYPFVKIGARLFGGFDLEAYSPVEAMRSCKVPVIFYHGDGDTLVPWQMSKSNFEACASRKRLVVVPDAAHGLSFPVAQLAYLRAAWEFFGPEASHKDYSGLEFAAQEACCAGSKNVV